MAAYRYIKARPHRPMRRSVMISFIFMGIGGVILLWAFWPILLFHLVESPLLASVITPLGDAYANQNGNRAQQSLVYAKDQSGTITNGPSAVDLTDANAWYPQKPQQKVVSKVNAYTLSIPKLGITNAFVVIGGDDLNHTLVHYGGTAFPGQNGNGVVFGHSVLPQFFNQQNYKTIFSTLPMLEIGDSIIVTYDSVTYEYKIESMTVRQPEDLTVLDQQYDDSYITLVTCVPPGTTWERLDVRARLVKI